MEVDKYNSIQMEHVISIFIRQWTTEDKTNKLKDSPQ